jgi:hypothetical protein
MDPLPWPAQNHLQAAEGWLELGNAQEANQELERITPSLRAHPAVLDLRWGISLRPPSSAPCPPSSRFLSAEGKQKIGAHPRR